MKKRVDSNIFLFILSVPEWRNWQTRWTQNPVDRKARVGSIPSSGTSFPLILDVLDIFRVVIYSPSIGMNGDIGYRLRR